MTVSADYPVPVMVNGFACRNCTDVDNAQKHIDPAHPQSGPYNVNARNDPSRVSAPAVVFGGALSGLNADLSRNTQGQYGQGQYAQGQSALGRPAGASGPQGSGALVSVSV